MRARRYEMRLAARSTEEERLDTEFGRYEDYRDALADLARVNRLTRTHAPTLAWLRQATRGLSGFSLLDVACGQGDLLRRIALFAEKRGLDASLTGLDRHPWSVRAAREATPPGIAFVEADVFEADMKAFDFVVTSQFIHHLDDATIVRFLQWMERHARRGWFVADLHRHPVPYYGFGVLGRVFGYKRIVREDGQLSIARGFRPDQLRALVAEAGLADVARVRWRMPFRLTVERLH